MSKRYVYLLVLLFVLVISAILLNNLLLGNAKQIRLKAADPLSSAVSRTLGSSGSSDGLAKEGQDYTVDYKKSFDNNTWFVVRIEPGSGKSFDPGVIILRDNHGLILPVVGPGSIFSKDITSILPNDVVQFLNDGGYINVPESD